MQKSKTILISGIILIFAATVGLYVFFAKDVTAPSDTQKYTQDEKKVANKKETIGDQTATKEECFQALKENLHEAQIFEEPLQTLDTMTYQDLSAKLSRNYKGLSSFGLDIDQDRFEMRLYSFGRQTGYVHPPVTPFPITTKSEMWDEPAKEFIVAEEYIRDDDGNVRFLDCAFVHLASFDPSEITRDDYFYDGPMISLLKTATDNSYKALYYENVSFDHASRPFMSWDRLFVYPQSAHNEYFDRYSVAGAYPANKVEKFDILGFFLRPMIQIQDYNENGGTVMKFISVDEESGEKTELELPAALKPIVFGVTDTMFPMADYYQAIENQFPAFATLLSYRGSLKYATFKELMAQKQDPEVERILAALADYRQLVSYQKNKRINEKDGVVVSDENLDALLLKTANADQAVKEIVGEKNDESQDMDVKEDFVTHKNGHSAMIVSIGCVIFLVIMIVLIKKYKSNN